MTTKSSQCWGWLIGYAVLLICTVRCLGTDWPQYRGINHDGTSPDRVRTNWTSMPPQILWRTKLEERQGESYSTFCVCGTQAYTLTVWNSNGIRWEGCVALDADTGIQRWFTPISKVRSTVNSTPATDGQRVYVLTGALQLACLEAQSGRKLWQRDLTVEDLGRPFGSVSSYGNAASPLLEGGLVFVNCSAQDGFALLAVRKTDGAIAWKRQGGPSGFASPIAATILGKRQVLFITVTELISVDPETGSVLWSLPGTNDPYATPVVAHDVVVYRNYHDSTTGANSAMGVKISRSGSLFEAQRIWSSDAVFQPYANPACYQDHIYWPVYPGLACINSQTGKPSWINHDYAVPSIKNIVIAGDRLLAINGYRSFFLADANPTNFTPRTSLFTISNTFQEYCLNHPVLSGGRLYIHSNGEGVCIDIAEPSLLKWQLQTPSWLPDRTFEIIASTVPPASMNPNNPNQAPQIDLMATTNLKMPLTRWTVLTNSIPQTNGTVRFIDPDAAIFPQRFYLGRQRP